MRRLAVPAVAALTALALLAGCGGGDDAQPPTSAATNDAAAAIESAAVRFGREEEGQGRIASPEAREALTSAIADYITAGEGSLPEAAEVAQEAIEDDLGRELPPGTMARALGVDAP